MNSRCSGKNKWQDAQLGLCFCAHCVREAESKGIDATGLKRQVARHVEAHRESDTDFADDMAEVFWLADVRDGEMSAYLQLRCESVTSLVAEIRGAVGGDAIGYVIPSIVRPSAGAWYEGTDLAALAEVADVIEACFYEPGVQRVRADIFDVKRRMRGEGKLRGILRPDWPDLQSKDEIVGAAAALCDAGITDIAFDNYGHLRRSNLAWIADALAVLGD